MRLGPLGTWRPAPGRVWEIRPTATTRAAVEDSPVSPGAPSFLQGDHLGAFAALRDGGGTHMAWTGVASVVHARFDGDRWCRALGAFLADHEGQRSWFELPTDEPPVRRLLGAETVTAPGAFELVEVDLGPDLDSTRPGDFADALHAWIAATFPDRCRPDGWPAFGMLVVEHDEEFAFIWCCDHAFTDAASQLLVGTELPERYDALGRGVEPDPAIVAPADERGSFLAHAGAERDRAASYGPTSPEVARWREMIAERGGLPSFPLDLGLAPGASAPVRVHVLDLVSGEDLVCLEKQAKANGARVPSAVIAACAATEARLTGRERYLGVTVMGTRDQGPHARAQGWFCNFAPLAVDLRGHDRFSTVLPVAEGAFAEARALARMPVHAALGHLLLEGTLSPESLGSPQLLSYLDLRWFPGARGTGAAADAYREGLHFTGEGRTRNASSWFNRDDERLYVAVQAPDTPEAALSVRQYFGQVRSLLLSLAQTGDAWVTSGVPAGRIDAAHAR
ncbi:hypothetical protein FXB39_14000 [Nocardioides sp. BGMRC 2183]|nr:hypothetical protein FXB39_14000 [Nocardioides sp. BGMRC 2183]